jgi:16S rRNA processing protein RimM
MPQPIARSSGAELPLDGVAVGRIDGAYGVKGAVRVVTFNDPQDSVLRRAKRWCVAEASHRDAGVPKQGARPFPLPIEMKPGSCRVHGDGLVATLDGASTKEQADALRGCELIVSRAEFPPAEEDQYYWVDLIGCEVVTPSGAPLGRVEAVDDHGAHPLLRLRGEDGRERLIPFVEAHVPEVNIAARRIVADWDPEF